MCPSDGLGFLSRTLLRGLFISTAALHLPENTLSLHFLLECTQCLIDVIIANEYLNQNSLLATFGFLLRPDKYGARGTIASKKYGWGSVVTRQVAAPHEPEYAMADDRQAGHQIAADPNRGHYRKQYCLRSTSR